MEPEFEHTTLPFRSSREALEAFQSAQVQEGFKDGQAQSRAKVSTVGLSVVWSPLVTSEKGPLVRSISCRAVDGFYDVLIGHTGERQGLRSDRQGLRIPHTRNGEATAI